MSSWSAVGESSIRLMVRRGVGDVAKVGKQRYMRSRGEWRAWLQKHHAAEDELWLIFYKKHTGKAGLVYEEAVQEALCFGWIDGIMKSVDQDRFVLRFSPRKTNSIWSRRNKDKAEQLVAQGRMTIAGLARIDEAKKNGSWEAAYTNQTREEIPPDLKKALMKNPTARKNFQRFANSYRNMYIGWINGAKAEKTREKRIIEVVERSTQNIKPGM